MWKAQDLDLFEIQRDESMVLPLGFKLRFQNLKHLFFTGRIEKMEELFRHPHNLAKVSGDKCRFDLYFGEDQKKTAVLHYLSHLQSLWEQDSQMDKIMQNFEVLLVCRCNGLINLIPPAGSFQNLTNLHVYGCHGLETIVTFSMAKSLVNLESMSITWCGGLMEVIQNQGEITEEKIVLSNLRILELGAVDKLTSFYSSNLTLELPFLEELQLHGCKKLETFSRGNLILPRLQEVWINRKSFRLCPETNLNSIIQQHYEKGYAFIHCTGILLPFTRLFLFTFFKIIFLYNFC